MKNKIIYIIFIYILFLSNIQSVFAEINGTIRDRVPESLILEYFPDYNKTQLNKNDNRIIEILKSPNNFPIPISGSNDLALTVCHI